MSLMVHPAPRMMNDPRPNSAHSFMSGREPSGCVAKAVDQRHGCSSNIVPIGLSRRAKCAYGWSEGGR